MLFCSFMLLLHADVTENTYGDSDSIHKAKQDLKNFSSYITLLALSMTSPCLTNRHLSIGLPRHRLYMVSRPRTRENMSKIRIPRQK